MPTASINIANCFNDSHLRKKCSTASIKAQSMPSAKLSISVNNFHYREWLWIKNLDVIFAIHYAPLFSSTMQLYLALCSIIQHYLPPCSSHYSSIKPSNYYSPVTIWYCSHIIQIVINHFQWRKNKPKIGIRISNASMSGAIMKPLMQPSIKPWLSTDFKQFQVHNNL